MATDVPTGHPAVPSHMDASMCPALKAGMSEKRRAALMMGLGGAGAAAGGGCPVKETPGFRQLYWGWGVLVAAATAARPACLLVLFHLIYLALPLGAALGPPLLAALGPSAWHRRAGAAAVCAYAAWFAYSHPSEKRDGRPWPLFAEARARNGSGAPRGVCGRATSLSP